MSESVTTFTVHNSLFTILSTSLVVPKAVLAYQGQSAVPNTFDLICGLFIALAFYWLGEYRKLDSGRLDWYYKRYVPSIFLDVLRWTGNAVAQAITQSRYWRADTLAPSRQFSYPDLDVETSVSGIGQLGVKDMNTRESSQVLRRRGRQYRWHSDEVWDLQWSHNGQYLASAGMDKSTIIWRIEKNTDSSAWDMVPDQTLRGHPYFIGTLAWSLDDEVLVTSTEHLIMMWKVKAGTRIKELDLHKDTVTALEWLPDGSGFISGSVDGRIMIWNANGTLRRQWTPTLQRLHSLAITPDASYLVVAHLSKPIAQTGFILESPLIVYNFTTEEVTKLAQPHEEIVSVKVSQCSRFVLTNQVSSVICLWDLSSLQLLRKYTAKGFCSNRHVIRSCFAGFNGSLIISGSEDGSVYVWHRDTGTLLEVLSGHGQGTVNSVAYLWQKRIFASCSDDHTIRIWDEPSIPLRLWCSDNITAIRSGMKSAVTSMLHTAHIL